MTQCHHSFLGDIFPEQLTRDKIVEHLQADIQSVDNYMSWGYTQARKLDMSLDANVKQVGRVIQGMREGARATAKNGDSRAPCF